MEEEMEEEEEEEEGIDKCRTPGGEQSGLF